MEHQDLADFIKSVHIDLRLRSREVGSETAWLEHCRHQETLKKYAFAMKELATAHWDKNMSGPNCIQSRMIWVVERCDSYFFRLGKNKFIEKETKMASKNNLQCEFLDEFAGIEVVSLLDVGSCYNPMSCFPTLKVTAIDLEPACEGVHKCDFLSVQVGDEFLVSNDSVCKQLPIETYDVVLFSLLLAYMPSPSQRYAACEKAVKLLKKGGLLIITTADSCHETANSRLVKRWRHALASLGMWLLDVEKLKHIRCFAFAKAHDERIVNEWLVKRKVELPPQEAITIPQDYNPYENYLKKKNNDTERSNIEKIKLDESFQEVIVEPGIFD